MNWFEYFYPILNNIFWSSWRMWFHIDRLGHELIVWLWVSPLTLMCLFPQIYEMGTLGSVSTPDRLSLCSLVRLMLVGKKRTDFSSSLHSWSNSLVPTLPFFSCSMVSKKVNAGRYRAYRIMIILLCASWYFTWSLNIAT